MVVICRKIGMTTMFDKRGESFPITVVEMSDNIVIYIDKYLKYVRLILDEIRSKKISKSVLGIIKKFNFGSNIWSVPYNCNIHKKVGSLININIFLGVNKVDVTGISKGKGYCGTIKKWGFKSQDKSHGNSLSHRAPGSIGQNQTPGKVFKGKKMSGRMGNDRVTILNIKIMDVCLDKKLLLLKGSIPGGNKSFLIIRNAIKK